MLYHRWHLLLLRGAVDASVKPGGVIAVKAKRRWMSPRSPEAMANLETCWMPLGTTLELSWVCFEAIETPLGFTLLCVRLCVLLYTSVFHFFACPQDIGGHLFAYFCTHRTCILSSL